MDNPDKKDELNIEIRKFLKQVGVGSHKLIEEQLYKKLPNNNICIKLEINNKQVKVFETTLNINSST